jgi:uncharacterized protein (TIGR01777 family)
MRMQVVVTGATGLIGSHVVAALLARGDEVRALTRDAQRARSQLGASPALALHDWPNPSHDQPPLDALDGADAVVHLLGESVAQRWSDAAKQAIRTSRVQATRLLVDAFHALSDGRRPHTLVSQSATGYYGARGDEQLDESAPPGDDFLAQVTVDWEREALRAGPTTRVVLTRTGVVLSPRGGALAKMLPPFRLGIGGPVAGGRQYVPWIHPHDVTGAILHGLDRSDVNGAMNLAAPYAVTNGELSRTLGRVLHRPAIFPVPAAALRALYGEMSSIIVTGQRPVPARLRASGYQFRFPELELALRDVLGRDDTAD